MPQILILLICLIAGCATPATEKFDSLISQQDPIAVGELTRAGRLFANLEARGNLMSLGDADDYMSAMLAKLYPEQHQDFKIHIARLPGENAFALSTGVVVIHLSLLAALENEHQLAFVLAHEFEHINARHGYLGAHIRRNTRVKAHLTDLLVMGSGLSYPYFASGLQEFNRAQELEADQRAALVLLKAGFDVAEAARFFDVLVDYVNPTQLLVQSGTHPDNQVRKKELLTLAAMQDRSGSEYSSSGYQSIRPLLLRLSIEEKIEDLDFLSALVQAEALSAYPAERAQVHCFEGEIYHQMAVTHPELFADIVLVKDMREHAGFDLPVVFTAASSRAYFLNRATSEFVALEKLQPDSSCSARGLGVTFLAIGQHVQARDHLRRYLRLNPGAHDRRYILDLLSTSAAI